MDPKEYLSQAHRLDQRIQLVKEDIEQLQSIALSVSSPSFEEHHNATRNTEAPFVRTLYLLFKQQEELNIKLKLMIKLKSEILEVIEELENKDERLILTYRYLRNWTWKQIADELYVDERTIRRWHVQALSHLILPENMTIC